MIFHCSIDVRCSVEAWNPGFHFAPEKLFEAIPKMGMRLTMGKIPKVSGKLKGFSSTAIDFGFGCILVMGINHVFL